ncbi:MAG TPA: oligopeptidase A, partial [Legionellaceae bacterium]|nr:oligopeptidase A [Legionellaceae bacterium]
MHQDELPKFHSIDITHFVQGLETLLASHLQRIALLSAQTHPTWETLMHPLEEMQNELEKYWSPLSHLHAVVNTPALRNCYETCLPKLSAYESALGQNHALYEAVKRIDPVSLNAAQQKIISDQLRNFVLAGV